MPVLDLLGIKVYELDFATSFSRYYRCYDFGTFLVLNDKGSVITESEAFYCGALYSDICRVLKGDEESLYKTDNIDGLIKTFGGMAGFLEEFEEEAYTAKNDMER